MLKIEKLGKKMTALDHLQENPSLQRYTREFVVAVTAERGFFSWSLSLQGTAVSFGVSRDMNKFVEALRWIGSMTRERA